MVAGAAGSGGDAVLQLEFGPMWEGLVKYVTFRDALKENPVTVILTTDMMERIVVGCKGEGTACHGPLHGSRNDGREGQGQPAGVGGSHARSVPIQGRPEMEGQCCCSEVLVYNVPIPPKAKALAGQMGVVVQGYAVAEDGSRIEGAVMTANAYYKILPADYAPVEDGSVTPTLSQQLQGEIEKIKKDILGAAGAADAKEAAQAAARQAETAKIQAEESAQVAEEGAQRAEGAKELAERRAEEAKNARTDAQTAQLGAQRAREEAESAQREAQRAQEVAEEAGDRAESAQVGAQEAERRGKGYRDEALAARDAAREAQDGAERARDTAVSAKETAEECRTQAWIERLLAQEAKDRAEEAAQRAEAAKIGAETAEKKSLEVRDEARSALQQIRMEQGDIREEQKEIRALGEETRKTRDEAVSARDETLSLRDETVSARDESLAARGEAKGSEEKAAEAAQEAERWCAQAREISGGDFITPTELAGELKGKADIPLMGPAELAEGLEVGGVLFVTDGEIQTVAKEDIENSWGESY